MKVYEHKLVHDSSYQNFERKLNTLSQEGWEFATAYSGNYDNETHFAIMKKEKPVKWENTKKE